MRTGCGTERFSRLQALVQSPQLFKQPVEFQEHRCIRRPLGVEVDADERTNRLAVVNRVFDTFVRKPNALRATHAQHPRQADWRAASTFHCSDSTARSGHAVSTKVSHFRPSRSRPSQCPVTRLPFGDDCVSRQKPSGARAVLSTAYEVRVSLLGGRNPRPWLTASVQGQLALRKIAITFACVWQRGGSAL